MEKDTQKLTRGSLLQRIAVAPIAIGAFAALQASQADALVDNKKQFKYQNKPGPKGAKCSGCSLYKAPNACAVVNGKIAPNGWCVAYAAKHK